MKCMLCWEMLTKSELAAEDSFVRVSGVYKEHRETLDLPLCEAHGRMLIKHIRRVVPAALFAKRT